MGKRRWIGLAIAALVAVATVSWFVRAASIGGVNATSVAVAASPAQGGKSAQVSGSITIQNSLPQLANPLSNLVPDLLASPAKKLQRLNTLGDPFAAQLEAVRSVDPLLIAHSVYLTLHCMDMPVQLSGHGKSVRQLVTEWSLDPKTGKKTAPDEALISMYEAMQSAGPLRVRSPPELTAEVARLNQTFGLGSSPYYARVAEIQNKMGASESASQRANWSAAIERSASECRSRLFGSDFGAEYRTALDRLAANGVVSAQLFNTRAGWKSDGLSDLNDRDYELVQRAINERQPDGIARLLVGGSAAVGRLNDTGFTEADYGAALMLGFSLGPLAACALGVSDCGPDSTRFRSLCHGVGGCEQPDMAALLRHVFERDGLDSTIVDREINRVVDAYRARDLGALGVQRKK